jgi:ferrous iron transport protein B
MAASGCNVPAIVATRVLPTRKERTIASALIVMIPCSARIAVISGAVSRFVGRGPALAIFGLDALLVALAGVFLRRAIPGKGPGLLMEVFPLRRPSFQAVVKKAWFRAEAFVLKAVPLVTLGSLALGSLYETGWVWRVEAPLRPILAYLLRIPTVAGIALIFAVLRKELALQLLVALAAVKYGPGAENLLKFMSPGQIWVYALVNTVQVPCVATLAALSAELGRARAAAIALGTVLVALSVGSIAALLLRLPVPG